MTPSTDSRHADTTTELSLIVPIVTMAKIEAEQRDPVLRAVADRGVGLAGCHGGMCDAFREDTEWQFMTGGQWVAHPGNDGVRYRVEINLDRPHPITEGLSRFRSRQRAVLPPHRPRKHRPRHHEFPDQGATVHIPRTRAGCLRFGRRCTATDGFSTTPSAISAALLKSRCRASSCAAAFCGLPDYSKFTLSSCDALLARG